MLASTMHRSVAMRPATRATAKSVKSTSRSLSVVVRAAVDVTAKPRSVVDLIKSEHKDVEELYSKYKSSGVSGEQKDEFAWHIIRALSIHAAKEEMAVYPEIRNKLGNEEADHSVAEHQELKEKLDLLVSMDTGHPDFASQLESVYQSFKQHADEEENKILPAFANADGVDADYLGSLGEKFEASEAFAPTRPHPRAPATPPLNGPLNASVVPLDKARDAAKFGTPNPESGVSNN